MGYSTIKLTFGVISEPFFGKIFWTKAWAIVQGKNSIFNFKLAF